MEPPGGRADQRGETALDGHVNVFEIPVLGHAVALVLVRDLRQPGVDRGGIFPGNDPLRGQHRGMGAARSNILAPQRLVEGDRSVDFAHDRARASGEPAPPHLVGA